MIARPLFVPLFLLALLQAPSVAAQTQWHMIIGPEDTVDIGLVHNAPNGHLSFQETKRGLTLWIDGRVDSVAGSRGKKNSVQGTFLLHPASWSTTDLEHPRDSVLNVFKANHDTINITSCKQDNAWIRDYAAINAIIPGPNRGELLAFIDGEFHPLKKGNPLLASIGLATSTDGVRWNGVAQVIQGNDVTLNKDCSVVTRTMHKNADNEGAAGPSAVIRIDGTTRYIYLYYEDRVRLTQKGRPTSDVYVARAPYSSGGAKGSWQKWTGSGWGGSNNTAAAPVVTTPAGAGESAHPNVSYNSSLKAWLMVFHTTRGLYATKSTDGLKWDTPIAIVPSVPNVRAPSFPTLVTPGNSDQQTTGQSGTLFYSREINKSSPTGKNAYKGYRRPFTIAFSQKKGCATPKDCCELNGGTWSGGRCQ